VECFFFFKGEKEEEEEVVLFPTYRENSWKAVVNANVSCTTLTQLLHNSNYFFFFFFMINHCSGFVFLHVGPKYSMIDF